MKTGLLITLAIGIIGFAVIAFAEHDPNQPQYHSIILPSDMKEKTFEEFIEWCMPIYGDKCIKLGKNKITSTLSPLKQFKLGIPVDEIRCKESLILVTRHDVSPACVTEQTKEKLIERRWTQFQFSFCGADGFDSNGNLNKSNYMHNWDENYCKWDIIDTASNVEQEKKDQLQIKKIFEHCNMDGIKPSILYKFLNSTHYVDSNSCKWEIGHEN